MFGFSFDKTMEEVKQELDAGKDIQLIDVRETDEYRDGHIPGADHLAPVSYTHLDVYKRQP